MSSKTFFATGLSFLLATAPISAADEAGTGPSMSVALLLTAGGTILPIVAARTISNSTSDQSHEKLVVSLALGGILAGPSMGEIYAGSYGTALANTAIRTVGGFLALAGMASAITSCGASFGGDRECDEDRESDGSGLAWGGLGVYVLGAALSIHYMGKAVEDWHQRHPSRLDLSPTLALDQDGAWAPGMRASLRF